MTKRYSPKVLTNNDLPLSEAHIKHQEKRRQMIKERAEKFGYRYDYTKKVGRPTNYLPEFCDMIIDIADDPNTVTLVQEFCSRAFTSEDKVYEWIREHDDFGKAYKIAMSKWENKFTNQCFFENKSPILFKFLMNRQRGVKVDQTEIVHSIKNVSEIQKLLSDEDTEITDI